jgi:hypothetical protein
MRETSTPVDSSAGRKSVKFWSRNGWKFLLSLVLVIGLFGIGDVVFGLDADPAIPEGVAGMSPDEIRELSTPLATLVDLQARAGGVHLLMASVLWTAIVVIPYRRRERWAWYTMWTFPAWSLAVAVAFLFVERQPDAPIPPPAVSGWVFFGLTALLLLGARRDFESSR